MSAGVVASSLEKPVLDACFGLQREIEDGMPGKKVCFQI
jgi:hypothetical protein